jgi:hypothetical protein
MRFGCWGAKADADKRGDSGGEQVKVLFVCLGSTRSEGRAP